MHSRRGDVSADHAHTSFTKFSAMVSHFFFVDRRKECSYIRKRKPRQPIRMRKQILFVDDDPLFIDLARDVLTIQEIEVLAAIDGTEALDLLKTFIPQMIVSDFEMPGMNGVELHSRLQENEATRNIRFVFMTGSSDKTFSEYARTHNIRVFSKSNLVKDLVRLSAELQ